MGLMLQRLVTAAVLICTAVSHLHPASQVGSIAPQSSTLAPGPFSFSACGPPATGAVVAGRQLWLLLVAKKIPGWLLLLRLLEQHWR